MSFFFLLHILFYIWVQQVNNVVIVSGTQQSDSAIHIHVSILPQAPLPSRLPHDIEQSSLCYTGGPCWLSILNIAVHTLNPCLWIYKNDSPPAEWDWEGRRTFKRRWHAELWSSASSKVHSWVPKGCELWVGFEFWSVSLISVIQWHSVSTGECWWRNQLP